MSWSKTEHEENETQQQKPLRRHNSCSPAPSSHNEPHAKCNLKGDLGLTSSSSSNTSQAVQLPFSGWGREGGQGGGGRSVGRSVWVSLSPSQCAPRWKHPNVGPLFLPRRTAGGSHSSGRVHTSHLISIFAPLRFFLLLSLLQNWKTRHAWWDLTVYKVNLRPCVQAYTQTGQRSATWGVWRGEGQGNFMTCSRWTSDCTT